MFAALSKAFAQCSDPAFRGVFLAALLASVASFIVVWIVAWFGLSWADDSVSGWIAAQQASGFWAGVLEAMQWLLGALAVVGMLVASIILFPSFTMLFMGLLLDKVAEAVERRHYPDLPSARHQPIAEGLRNALSFAAATILLNLLFLPLYLLLLFLTPLNLFVFYGLNGYLLGREYFELVAVRRLDPEPMRRLRRARRGRVFLAGIVIAFLLTIPLVNLVIPIVATGFMVHIFEDIRQRNAAAGRA